MNDLTKANKSTISNLLMEQAKDCLLLAIEHRKTNEFRKEVQLGLNIHLLIGITLEGIINEIGDQLIDTWTWKELEKVNTPLKWKIISGLNRGFDPSKEPLQTVSQIQTIRNKIAHPKSKNFGNDAIIRSESGLIKRNLKDEDVLPEDNFDLYIGYEELIKEYNARVSQSNMKKVLRAIIELKSRLPIGNKFEWCASMFQEINKISISKNEFDK